MGLDINNYKVTRSKLTTEEEVTDFLGTMYSSDMKIVDVQSYRYVASSGDFIQATYTPSAYKKYHTDTSRRKQINNSEPYVRYGYDNKFPFFLYDLFTKSAVHKRSTKNISNIAYGRGLFPCNQESEPFYKWLRARISTKALKNIFENMSIYGGSFVTLNFEGTTNDKLFHSLAMDQFYNWRVGKPADKDSPNFGEVLYHWHHPNYNATKTDRKFLRGIPVYTTYEQAIKNTRKIIGKGGDPFYKKGNAKLNNNKFVSLIGEPETESEFYPTPSYLTDTFIDACMVDAALSSFDIAGLKNGLSAGYIVTVPISGIDKLKKSNKDEYDKVMASLKDKTMQELEGDENHGVSIVVVQDVGNSSDVPVAIDIKEIPHTNNADIHKILEERKNRNLLTAWGVLDSRIIGIPAMSGTGFASQAELFKIASQLFYDQVVFPEIVDPVEEWLNDVMLNIWAMETNVSALDLVDRPIGVKFQRTRSFTITPDSTMLDKYLLLDEVRDLLGVSTLNEEQAAELDKQKEERSRLEYLKKAGSFNSTAGPVNNNIVSSPSGPDANYEFMQAVAKACNMNLLDLIKMIE